MHDWSRNRLLAGTFDAATLVWTDIAGGTAYPLPNASVALLTSAAGTVASPFVKSAAAAPLVSLPPLLPPP